MVFSEDGTLGAAPSTSSEQPSSSSGGGGGAAAEGDDDDDGEALVMSASKPKKGGVVRKLAAEKASLTAEVSAAKKQVEELKAALGVITHENEALEVKVGKEREKASKAKDSVKQVQAEAKEASKQWVAERKRLMEAWDEAGKRADASEKALAKTTRALEVAEDANRAKLERGELPPPPEGADDSTVAMAALNQELVNAKLRCAELDAERSNLKAEVRRLHASSAPSAASSAAPSAESSQEGGSGGGEEGGAPSAGVMFSMMDTSVQSAVAASEQRSDTLRSELEACQVQLAAAIAEAKSEAAAREEGQRRMGSLEVQLAEAKQKYDQSAEALGVLTSEQSTLEGKLQKEKERNTKAKEVVMKQQAERKSLVQQKEELEAKVKSGSKELEQLKTHFNDLHRAAEKARMDGKELSEAKKGLLEQRKDLEGQLKQARTECDALTRRVEKEGNALAKAKERLQAGSAQLQDERQKSSNAEAQIEKLKQKLQQLSSSRDQAEWKAAQAREDEEDSSAQLEALQSKVGLLERELASAHSEAQKKELMMMEESGGGETARRIESERDDLILQNRTLNSKCTGMSLEMAEVKVQAGNARKAWEAEKADLERRLLEASSNSFAPQQAQQQEGFADFANFGGAPASAPPPPSSSNPTQVAADVLQWRQRAEAAQREADTRIQQVGGLTAEINTLKSQLEDVKASVKNAPDLAKRQEAERIAAAERAKVAEAAAAEAKAEVSASKGRIAALQDAAMELERIKDGLEEEVQTIRSAQAESDESRNARAAALKEKTQSYVQQLQATHRQALQEATERTSSLEAAVDEARSELEQTQNAAAATISELRQKVVSAERGAELQAADAVAAARSECEVEIANLQAELMLQKAANTSSGHGDGTGGGGEAVEAAAASSSEAASSSSSSSAATKTRRDDDVSYADEIELLEKQLLHAQATHAELLTRTSAALEGEAEVRIELKLLEERTSRERTALDAKLTSLQKDLEALTRLKKGAGVKVVKPGGETYAASADRGGAIEAAVAALTPDALRREVLSQHRTLSAMAEALVVAEERVRALEAGGE